MPFSAEIVLDSVSPAGYRLTTFKLRYPRFIHAELMTHRVFSRNASSSRAVPTEKLIEEALDRAKRAAPIHWGKHQKGMGAAEELTGEELETAKWHWEMAAQMAVRHTRHMALAGAAKQIINRLLEPFTHINVVVTSTEYMNFFGLRLDAGAQPEIRYLAELMYEQYTCDKPTLLVPGQWHLPFITDTYNTLERLEELIKISVARCARVSYMSFETGKVSTPEEDLKLYARLVGAQPLHASPAEHQATPDIWHQANMASERGLWSHPEQHGNFTGWRQYRKMLVGENMAPLPERYR